MLVLTKLNVGIITLPEKYLHHRLLELLHHLHNADQALQHVLNMSCKDWFGDNIVMAEALPEMYGRGILVYYSSASCSSVCLVHAGKPGR